MFFHSDQPLQSYYAFTYCVNGCVDAGGTGYYALFAIRPIAKGGSYRLTADGITSPYIHAVLNTPNMLTVVVLGNNIYLYANGHSVNPANAPIHDESFSSGELGVTAYDYLVGDPTEVAFSNAHVWLLS